jgi:hypothetical protein
MKYLKINEIKLNPNNPRIIKDDKFTKLVQSIKDFPEMLDIRPIVVNQDMIILGGNMRFKACKEAGLKEIPVIVTDLTEEQQREFLIKDNVSGGEWDWDLLNEWDTEQLEDWGLDIPFDEKIDKLEEGETLDIPKSLQVIPKKEYLLIMADEDSEDWEELKQIFSCGLVRQGGCTIGSSSDKVGTGLERVFDLKTFKERVLNGLRNSNTK